MSASVVAALACAVFAAVGTGVLVGRSIRVPRLDLVAWACALLALAVALGAQAYGMYRGYGSGTFRAVQFGAQLIAPLWLAWGLTELTAKSGITRFGAKLITMALTVVTGVVLVTDPLSGTPFSTTWPAASKHYQIIPRSLLSLIAAVTVAAVLIALISGLLRLRSGPAWRRPVIAIAAAGIGAVLVLGLRLTLPNAAYLALCAGCAALTWFAGLWAARIGLAELHGEVPPGRADRRGRPVAALAGESGEDEAFAGYEGADGGHRRYADRYGDDDWYRPAGGNQATSRNAPGGGYRYDGGIAMNGLNQGDRGGGDQLSERQAGFPDADRTAIWRPETLGGGALGSGAGLGGAGLGSGTGLGGGAALGDRAALGAGPGLGATGGLGRRGTNGGLGNGGPDRNGGFGADSGLDADNGLGGNGGPGGGARFGGDTGLGSDSGLGGSGGPGGGARFGGDTGLGGAALGGGAGLGREAGLGAKAKFGSDTGLGANGGLAGGHAAHGAAAAPAGPEPALADQAATQRLYGLIAIYTLAEGAADDFDALAERVVEEVRAGEPDALVYAVHSVPNAPMQRIFYEVYRDRMAYEDHQRQPHIQRFEADRSPHVLATNVIELGMQQAKLSPLPGLTQLFDRSPGA
jgi:quinol monooxygenase YgiN